MMLTAGDLRHRITIQVLAETQDVSGDTAPAETTDANWTTLCSRWAAIEPLVGRELLRSGVELAKGTTWVKLRNVDAITDTMTPKMRVKFKTRYFNVKSIQRVAEMRGDMWLLCEEIL